MTLLERVTVATTEECALDGCDFDHIVDGLFCGTTGAGHMADWLAGRIQRTGAGTYISVAGPQPRQPEWLRRAQLVRTGLARDLTGLEAL